MFCTRIVVTKEGFEKALKEKVDEIWIKGDYADEIIQRFDQETKERKTADGKHFGIMCASNIAMWLLPWPFTLPMLGITMAEAARIMEIGEPLKDYELVEFKKSSLLLKRKKKTKQKKGK